MEPPESDWCTDELDRLADSLSFHDSSMFSYISDLSPIKPLKAPVAQDFRGPSSPPLPLTSPQRLTQYQSGFLERSRCPQISDTELPQQDVNEDICEPEIQNTQLYAGLNPCTDEEYRNDKGDSPFTSGCLDEYFVDSCDSKDLAYLTSKQSSKVPTTSKKPVVKNRVDMSKDVITTERLSLHMLLQRDISTNDIGSEAIDEAERCHTQFYTGLNCCTDKEHGDQGFQHNEGDSSFTSGCFDEYFTDILVVDTHESGHLASSTLMPCDGVPISSKETVVHDRVETDGIKGGGYMPVRLAVEHADDEQQDEQSELDNEAAAHKIEQKSSSQLLPESMQLAQEYNNCSGNNGVISIEQNMMLHDSKTSQRQCRMRRRLQFEQEQQNNIANRHGTSNQSCTVINSKVPTSSLDSKVLESSCPEIDPGSCARQLENHRRPTSSTFANQNICNSSLTVPKPKGIGLHLNSIVSSMPVQNSSARIASAKGGHLNIKGKKFCITSSCGTDDARNSKTALNVLQKLSVITKENQYKDHESMIGSSGNPSPQNLKPLYDPLSAKRKPMTEHPDHEEAFTQSSPRKRRKKMLGSDDGDGCKRCNCKKSKCLKLYCDCFAAGIYCVDPCSCQGCFNRPEYEDTVLETRKLIESRNPLAFAPKVVKHVTELGEESTQEDIIHSTPSSAKHKRGCNCKKSMCLKRYCECYQSNVGCSDGCRCEECKNVFGKKEEYVSSNHNISNEATNERSAMIIDEKLENVATAKDGIFQTELCQPHNLSLPTEQFKCSDREKDSSSPERYIPSQQSDLTLSVPHGEPPGSQINCDNQETVQQASKCILPGISSETNSSADKKGNFSSHGLANTDPLSTHKNSSAGLAMTSLMPAKTSDWTKSPQFGPANGPFSSVSNITWRRSPVNLVNLVGETKLPQVFAAGNKLYNKIEDEDTPEILKDSPAPITSVKVSSPNKKRVSPPHICVPELASNSSVGLRSGRKFILKSVPSFPPLIPCTGIKYTTSQPANAHSERSDK